MRIYSFGLSFLGVSSNTAMAKKLVEGIEQELTCAVCLDRFKEPKVLPCLHTYCKACVEAMVAKSREKDGVVCPKCRERYTLPGEGASGFLSNFTLKNLLELLEVHETAGPGDKDSAKVLRCENGVDENVAVARCLVCCAYLCKTCWKLHVKMVATRNHETVSLEEIKKGGEKKLHKPQYCPEHEKEVLKLYCKTCSKAICGDCTYIDHRDHKYAFIKDVQQELRQELEGTVEGLRKKEGEFSEYLECLQRAQAEQEANVQACRQEVNRAFDSFVQRIQLCRDRVLEEVEKTAIADKKRLSAEADITEVSLAKVSSNLSFIDRLLTSGSDTEVVSMAAPTLERVKTVQGMKCEQKPEIVSGTLSIQEFKDVGHSIDRELSEYVDGISNRLRPVAQGLAPISPENIVTEGVQNLPCGMNTLTIREELKHFQPKVEVFLKAKGSGSKNSKGADKVPQRRTRDVHFQKRRGEDLGVMVYGDIYTLEHIRGFLVTGVQVGSKASDMVMKAELRLLDIVTHVNGIPVDELSGPFDEEMQRSAAASLVLNSTLSIVCPPSVKARATHVVALMNPHQFGLQAFGFDVRKNPGQEGLEVSAFTRDTVARQSGLKVYDIILSFAIATKDSPVKPKTCSDYEQFTWALREACDTGKPSTDMLSSVIVRDWCTDREVYCLKKVREDRNIGK